VLESNRVQRSTALNLADPSPSELNAPTVASKRSASVFFLVSDISSQQCAVLPSASAIMPALVLDPQRPSGTWHHAPAPAVRRAVQRTLPVFGPRGRGARAPRAGGPSGRCLAVLPGAPPASPHLAKNGFEELRRGTDLSRRAGGESQERLPGWATRSRSALAKGGAVRGGRLGVVWSPPAFAASTEAT
jgi:hypothetical protein